MTTLNICNISVNIVLKNSIEKFSLTVLSFRPDYHPVVYPKAKNWQVLLLTQDRIENSRSMGREVILISF